MALSLDVPFEDLVRAVMMQESGGNPNAVSSKGAIGLMQIMPDTARQYGVNPSRLHDPAANLMLGTKLLAKYLKDYGGDINSTLTAYNAGPGRVGRSLPGETKDYISKIWNRLGNMVEGTAYGADLPPTMKGAKEVPDPWGTPAAVSRMTEVPDPWKEVAPSPSPSALAAPVRTPEQGYEQKVAKLPSALQYVTPGTMGEAGFTAGSLAMPALVGLGLAPETLGTSLTLGLPLVGAAIGGALEDPAHRVAGAAYETAKGVGQEVFGGVGSRLLGYGTKLAQTTGMVQRLSSRVAKSGLGALFSQLPTTVPETGKGLSDVVGGGELKEAAGQRLGKFRDALRRMIPEYKPAVKPQLVPASSGAPFHYTPGTAALGVKFSLPNYAIDKDGNPIRTVTDFSIGDAIDHVRMLQAESYTAAGSPKSGDIAWLRREVGHDARQALRDQLNARQPGVGDTYAAISGDYGAATELTDVFKGDVYRTDGEIDQPKLLKAVRKIMPDLNRLKGNEKGTMFMRAISPTGASAVPEEPWGPHIHGGAHGLFAFMRPPFGYQPETPKLISQPWRALMDPRLRPLLGAIGVQGAEDVLGVKGQPIVEGGP